MSAQEPVVPELLGVVLPGDSATVRCANSSQWLVDEKIPAEDCVYNNHNNQASIPSVPLSCACAFV